MRERPMFRFRSLLLVALAFLFASDRRPTYAQFHAGASAVDITPVEFPLNMPGGFRANLAESAHDPFYSRALVLSDGKTTLAMLVVDNLGLAPEVIEVIEEAKAIAAESTGIRTDRMLIASTHTHSGPDSNGQSGPAAAYRKRLVKGIADSISKAHGHLRPARFGTASYPLAEEVFNRRWFLKPGKMPINPFGEMDQVKMNPPRRADVLDRPAGPVDPDVTVISIQEANQMPLCLFANYSLHYVGATPRGQLSADYFGEFSRLMPTRLRAGANFVAMMSNGTSGDINNIPFGVTRPPREPFEQIRVVARKAADAAWFAHEKIERHRSEVTVDMREREVTLRYRRPSVELEWRAREIVAMSDDQAIKELPRLAVDYAKRTVEAAERKEDSVTVKLQTIRIGDLAVCGIPFETLVEIGLEIKSTSPFSQTMVIGLANGRYGYLPTPKQHRLGGYETWLGTNYVQKDASVLIERELKGMLTELAASR
ncbi:MAG: neutral/alkaline non-lysosomal ceramidase N-terminal domain-containing protein [Planctomycetota bacterium]